MGRRSASLSSAWEASEGIMDIPPAPPPPPNLLQHDLLSQAVWSSRRWSLQQGTSFPQSPGSANKCLTSTTVGCPAASYCSHGAFMKGSPQLALLKELMLQICYNHISPHPRPPHRALFHLLVQHHA